MALETIVQDGRNRAWDRDCGERFVKVLVAIALADAKVDPVASSKLLKVHVYGSQISLLWRTMRLADRHRHYAQAAAHVTRFNRPKMYSLDQVFGLPFPTKGEPVPD
jgi:hypothetical protein